MTKVDDKRSNVPDETGYVEAEDEDFVFGEDLAADSFEDSCEREGGSGKTGKGKKRKRPDAGGSRNIGGRGGGALTLGDDDDMVKALQEREAALEAKRKAELEAAEAEQAQAKKSRMDDLWAELNGGSSETKPAPTTTSKTTATAVTKKKETVASVASSGAGSGKVSSSLAALLGDDDEEDKKPKKTAAEIAAALLAGKDSSPSAFETDETKKEGQVTIKETFDFAGKKVEVEKHVAADSHAAKKFSALQQGSGIDRLLASMGKKKLMTTTTKSRLDWDKHTKDAGDQDDLRVAAKNGYLEKQAFLARSEMREFEQRRNVNRKRLGVTDD